MNLQELVINKINELGDEAAMEYFGKTKNSIQAWKKGRNPIPLEAVQKVMDETNVAQVSYEGQYPAPTGGCCSPESQPMGDPMANNDERFESAFAAIDQLRQRIDYLDNFLQNHFGGGGDGGTAQAEANMTPFIPAQETHSMINPSAQVVPPAHLIKGGTQRVGPQPPAASRTPPATIPSMAGAWNVGHQKKPLAQPAQPAQPPVQQ